MTDGIRKPKRKQKSSTERRRTRARISELFGTEMVKCTRCKEKKLATCKATDNSDVCGNCLSVGNHSCDAFGYHDSAVERMVIEKRNLDREEQETADAIRTLMAKADRLRIQRRALEDRALVMFNQEGEVLAEQERREVSGAQPSSGAAAVPSSGPFWDQGCVLLSSPSFFFFGPPVDRV
jgi:hypothetical protein